MYRYLWPAAALLWGAFITVAYAKLYPLREIVSDLPHLPFLQLTGGSMLNLSIALLFIVAANGWGRIFWRAHHLNRLEKFLFATGAGLGFLALALLELGHGLAHRGALLLFQLLEQQVVADFQVVLVGADHQVQDPQFVQG